MMIIAAYEHVHYPGGSDRRIPGIPLRDRHGGARETKELAVFQLNSFHAPF